MLKEGFLSQEIQEGDVIKMNLDRKQGALKVFVNGVFANWKIESDLFRTNAGVWPAVMIS